MGQPNIHTYTHTHTHIYIHTQTYIYTHTYTQIHIHNFFKGDFVLKDYELPMELALDCD